MKTAMMQLRDKLEEAIKVTELEVDPMSIGIGKAKRMKGKTVKFEFTEDKTEAYQVIVNNVII